ncbi:MAG: hypothetical protein H7A35_12620 [Planctomycetales bacterium]|nr:hypothetical protein [bacterium]UNM07691.1 MAG: hypothetical protein H7A35_12620 [Planctomycetales bacterium]
MSRKILIAVIACLAMLAAACSTSNVGINEPERNEGVSSFSVDMLEGRGTFTPAVNVVENDNSAVVTIEAVGADDLATAALELSYDASRFTPERVEFSDFLGQPEDTFSFTLTDRCGIVPVGLSQVPGAEPVDGSGMLATVYFSNRPFTGERTVSQSATGVNNAVELSINPIDGNNVELSWTEKNVGDYDNNSEVNVGDITPLGIHLGKSASDFPSVAEFEVVDGDGNGLISLADITPIGQYYGNAISGYTVFLVQGGSESSATPGSITADRNDFWSAGQKTRPQYVKSVNVGGGVNGVNFLVKPMDSNMNEGAPSNEVGATVVPGAPEPPTAVSGLSDETTGNLTVKVNWTKSVSADVVSYEIERKLSSEDEFSFSVIGTSGSASSQYTDVRPDTTSVDYRVRAKDSEGLFSAYSDSVSVVPFKAAIPAPLNVTAAAKDGVNAAIEVKWQQPATIVKNYSVYSRVQGEVDWNKIYTTNFPLEKSYIDSGLNIGTTYEYVVTTITNEGESDYSEMASSMPSEVVIVPITITGLTTSKTTHHTSGSEGPANLSVTTDVTPTSVDWNASAGAITGTGSNVTWLPTGASVGKVTINVTVHNDGESDQGSIELIVTDDPIINKHTDNTPIGKNGTGEWIDFTQPSNKTPNAPYDSYSKYMANGENVVTINWWEQWCGPCLAEMPEMFAWSEEYGPDGYYHLGCSGDYSNGSNITFIQNKGWDGDYFIIFSKDDSNHAQWTLNPSIYEYWPDWNSIPRTILYDKDGWARRSAIGTLSGGSALAWENTMRELMGMPPK